MGQPVQSSPGAAIGQPVQTGPVSIANWTEDDLTNFIQKHLDKLPPQVLTPFLHAQSMKVGSDGLTLLGPISYRDMDAPIIVQSAQGPGLNSNWIDQGSPYPFTQFYRDPFGWVHLRGCVNGSTYTNPFFSLPPGYRPDTDAVHVCATFDNTNGTWGQAQLVISAADGSIKSNVTGTDGRQFFFDGVKFPLYTNKQY